MYNLAVCSIFKNESHILDEWIQHYKHRGVDHIYLVNDNSTDNYYPIIEKYGDYITLFHNDINTTNVGRQSLIYEKYFRGILSECTWIAILDLDEFLWSPQDKNFADILDTITEPNLLLIDWLHFGSNGHEYQPSSVVSSFKARAVLDRACQYYSYKSIARASSIIKFEIHVTSVSGSSYHMKYNEDTPPPLAINHYNIQSRDWYLRVKGTRGDADNWFEHTGYKRNLALFEKYDINDVVDTRLFDQNKRNETLYTISDRQLEDGVTLVITSCNRPQLLDKTLDSFVKMNTHPIVETYIIDDSGVIGCNDAVLEKYNDTLKIKSLYNTKNIGQVASIDKAYSYVHTKWIFHCEEDWVFLRMGFIEKSLQVFEENPSEKIYTVWLRPHSCTSGHPIIKDELNRGYFLMKKDFRYIDRGQEYIWGGITFNPGLRRTNVCLKYHPYTLVCDKSEYNDKTFVGEYTINKIYTDAGYYSMILADPSGHVNHIGWSAHIPREWD